MAAAFSCSCGAVKGHVAAMPDQGLHLVCYCDSCRAAARHCGADIGDGTPVDLYLTPAQHVSLAAGHENLSPFAFSPNGIMRWKTTCCGVQMFSSQPNPKNAFLSLVTDRLTSTTDAGPVRSKAFIPMDGGKARHEGKGALAGLVLRMLKARITGKWRETPLFDAATLKPIAPVTVISREEKAALLAANA